MTETPEFREPGMPEEGEQPAGTLKDRVEETQELVGRMESESSEAVKNGDEADNEQ